MTDRRDVLPFDAPDGHDDELAAIVAAMYAATPAADTGAADRCARAVLAQSMHVPERGAIGLLRPRWWWGAAAAMLVVAVAVKPWRSRAPLLDADSTATRGAATQTRANEVSQPTGTVTPIDGGDGVRFDLTLPAAAREVAIVGDFNGWDENATRMSRQSAAQTWSAEVPLAPGRHVYAFVVDGTRWLVDPLAPQVPDAGFGPSNAVIVEGGTR